MENDAHALPNKGESLDICKILLERSFEREMRYSQFWTSWLPAVLRKWNKWAVTEPLYNMEIHYGIYTMASTFSLG